MNNYESFEDYPKARNIVTGELKCFTCKMSLIKYVREHDEWEIKSN